jgi:uridine kinase
MNLLDEYLLTKKEVIILISGLSGSKKSLLAKEIERDLKNLKIVNLDDYCDNNKVPVIEIFGQKVKDWDDVVSYDWNKFNNDINKLKNKGCVVYGDSFPKDKLNFDTDFHIHITVSKEKLVEKRREFIEKNPDQCKDMILFIDKLSAFINKITYSHYIENRKKSKINLWLNSDENSLDKMYDESFDFIMNSMKKFLDEYYSINKRKLDYIKEDKFNKNREKTDEESNTNQNKKSKKHKKKIYIDELDKAYHEETKGAISIGEYYDLKQEAEFLPIKTG